MRRFFTKRFFQLSPTNQAASFDAEIRELERATGTAVSASDWRRITQRIAYMRRKAVEHGIHEK